MDADSGNIPDTGASIQDESTGVKPSSEETPLTYEETPIIEPVPPRTEETTPLDQNTAGKKKSVFPLFRTLLLFLLLFGIGFFLSGYVRQYLSTGTSSPSTSSSPTPTPLVSEEEMPIPEGTGSGSLVTGISGWKTYSVLSGVTRSSIETISFQLPPDVLSPICDGSECPSQGTYLPGGTRFTVAPRGDDQVLPKYTNQVISDLSGIPFTVKEATVGGKQAVEFSGTFTGTTVGGYAFTRMHGYMIEVSPTLTLEINHFTPAGISADFDSDDTLFEQIVQTLSSGSITGEKGAMLTGTPTSTSAIIPSPTIGTTTSSTAP